MSWRIAAGVVIGAMIGFAIGAGSYLLLEPILEGSSGWLREMQGLVWNLVPLLTVAGAVIGGLRVSRPARR